MDLSVVVVNWNSGERLARLLSLLAPLDEELRTVLVIDNGSVDRSLSGLPQLDRLEVLGLGYNAGFASAANLAIERVATSFVLLLNPDVEPHPETVRELYRRVREEKVVGIACALLVDSEGRPQDAFQIRPLPRWDRVLREVLFVDELFRPFKILFGARRSGLPPAGYLPRRLQPAAACWLLRREAWAGLGGFDDRFHPAWFEDVDFCRRLMETSWRIAFYPDLRVGHEGGHTLHLLGRREFHRIYYENLLVYLQKHHPGTYPLLRGPVRLGGWIRRRWLSP